MKQIFSIITLLCLSISAMLGQSTFTKTFSPAGKQKIILESSHFDFEIEGGSGNDVVVTTNQKQLPSPERAKGLQSLNNNSTTDNTGLGLNIQEAGGVMTIKNAGRRWMNYKFKVPSGADIIIEDQDRVGGEINIKDLSGEIEIKSKLSRIKMINITGPVVGNTVNSDIEIQFSQLNPTKPSHISAINGFIDITLPANTKANLELTATHGQVFSDFDVKQAEGKDEKPKSLAPSSVVNISGTINNGGVEISLNSINNNIYVRKK